MKTGFKLDILAIDVGKICGWSLYHAATCRIHSGRLDLNRRGKHGPGRKFLDFQISLQMLREEWPEICKVVYEKGIRFRSHAAISAHLGYCAHIESWCEDVGLLYEEVNPTTLKKHATGKGNANKDQMVAAALKKWPDLHDHNQADALWVLDWYLTNNGYEVQG